MAKGIFSPRNRQKSSEERMKELEELAKLNRGSFTTLAEDTKSNIPFMLPGQRMRPDFELNQPRLQRVAFPESEQLTEEDLNTDLPPLQTPDLQQPADEPISAIDFLDYFGQQYYAPDVSQGMGSTPDGGILQPDGSAQYPGGFIRRPAPGKRLDFNAWPRSNPDGTVSWSDDSTTSYIDPGVAGLSQGVFDRQQAITQAYGNYNPGMGYAGNIHGATDFRTRDLPEGYGYKIPVKSKVVQVINADSGSPWGNTIFVQLSNGQVLRFSHMAEPPQFAVGQEIPGETPFGTPGSTGNSTAEHADIGVYDQNGNELPTSEFKGFPKEEQQPQQPQQPQLAQQSQPQPQGQILGATDQQQPQQPQQSNAFQYTPPNEATQPKPDRPLNMDYTKIQPNPQKSIGVTVANAVDVANPTGNFDLGMTEGWRGDVLGSKQKRGEAIENIGTFIGAPELKTKELSQAQGTDPVKQLLGNVTDYMGNKLKQMGIDINADISEKIAGGRTTFSVPQANAAEPMQSIPTPGKGLEQLKSGGQVLGMQSTRPSMADISSPKVVGDVSGGDMSKMSNGSLPMDSAQMQSKMQSYDARDPFFRQGLNQKFASQIDPNKAESGALTLDLFKNGFFSNRGNVSQAFKGTSLEQPAAEKFMSGQKQNYLDKYGDASQYDQADVQRILASLPAASLNYTPSLPEPKRVVREPITSGPDQNASPSPWNNSQSASPSAPVGTPITSGPNQNASPSPWNRDYKPPMSIPYKPPMSTPAPQSQPNQQPQQSLFSSISNLFSRLFRR